MKQKSFSEKHADFFWYFAWATLGGLVMGAFLWLSHAPFNRSTPLSVSPRTASAATSTLSYFQQHYVNEGGRYARIPQKFCWDLDSARPNCDDDQSYLEIDTTNTPLPLDKIISAVSDLRSVIVYSVNSTTTTSDGCNTQDVYAYDILNKNTRKLTNDPSMWVCGASRSEIQSISDGGRYLAISTVGSSANARNWVYELSPNEGISSYLSNVYRPNTTQYFSLDNSRGDGFVVYLGCNKATTSTNSEDCRDDLGLYLVDDGDGYFPNTIRLTSVEKQLKNKHIPLSEIVNMTVSQNDDGEYAHELRIYKSGYWQDYSPNSRFIVRSLEKFMPSNWLIRGTW